jgi:glycosyltransferase involved in cell wall biosynthesis
MSLPRLTIITPSLNQETYLERAIRSVLEQGYPNLEYIVMDGGSTDGSVDVLRRFDSELAHWVSEPDQGQSHAINKGLARATGDVVAYLNSDDYYVPGAFEAVLPLFADQNVSWVSGTCRYLFEDGRVETVWRPRLPRGPRGSWVRFSWAVPQPASFWRRGLFDRFGQFREDLHYVLDTEFMLRIALAGCLPSIVDRELAVRWLHGQAKTADWSQFEREFELVARQLLGTLPRHERVLSWPYYAGLSVLRKLGLFRIRRDTS